MIEYVSKLPSPTEPNLSIFRSKNMTVATRLATAAEAV